MVEAIEILGLLVCAAGISAYVFYQMKVKK